MSRGRDRQETPGRAPPPLDLSGAPGHLIRRAQQLHTTLWAEYVSTAHTSIQFAALNTLASEQPLDQTTLGQRIGADRSTTTGVLQRLRQRGDVVAQRDASDARRNEVRLTDSGRRAFAELAPKVKALRQVIEGPLEPDEQRELRRLLGKLLEGRH
jgi:DNA-binding MarR family transcriptional regulator